MCLRSLKAFQSEDRGQDLAEYCLLTALVALIAVGILVHLSGGMQAVWGEANASLNPAHANTSVTPASSGKAGR